MTNNDADNLWRNFFKSLDDLIDFKIMLKYSRVKVEQELYIFLKDVLEMKYQGLEE